MISWYFHNSSLEIAFIVSNLYTTCLLIIGLKYIQELADQSHSEVRLDMTTHNNDTGYETFQDFKLKDGINYKLNIGLRDAGTRHLFWGSGLPARTLPYALTCFCLGSSWAPCRWLFYSVGWGFIERRLSLMILFVIFYTNVDSYSMKDQNVLRKYKIKYTQQIYFWQKDFILVLIDL
jgi:hypothetical protein